MNIGNHINNGSTQVPQTLVSGLQLNGKIVISWFSDQTNTSQSIFMSPELVRKLATDPASFFFTPPPSIVPNQQITFRPFPYRHNTEGTELERLERFFVGFHVTPEQKEELIQLATRTSARVGFTPTIKPTLIKDPTWPTWNDRTSPQTSSLLPESVKTCASGSGQAFTTVELKII